jgi:protein-S-isoprenylcysteine O-methyltransferase Ste14
VIKYYSNILVVIQFSALYIIVCESRLPVDHPLLLSLLALSLALGLWAIATMKIQNLKVFPEPKPDAEFVGAGPYKVIRHPMYTSVLLFGLSFTLETPTAITIITWFILCVDLLLKLHYEEGLLNEKFPSYRAYSAGTKKLIPFVY